MPGYLAALLFCVGAATVAVLVTGGKRWLSPWLHRLLVTGGLVLAVLMGLYLAMILLLLLRK